MVSRVQLLEMAQSLRDSADQLEQLNRARLRAALDAIDLPVVRISLDPEDVAEVVNDVEVVLAELRMAVER